MVVISTAAALIKRWAPPAEGSVLTLLKLLRMGGKTLQIKYRQSYKRPTG